MKNEKGSAVMTAPIIIALGIVFITTLIVFVIQILMPYIWYEKLSSACIKYLYIMEEYGYLTFNEKNNLKDELETMGFDSSIEIEATSKKQSYGDEIFLDIKYSYIMKLPILGEKTTPMRVRRYSVSKV